MEKKPAIVKKQDMILVAVLLVIAAALLMGYHLSHRASALRAEVSVGGEVVSTIDLGMDQEVTIFSYNGGYNHLTVKDGQICCDDASCPDKVCIQMGKQSLDGSMIVCLPNSMIVQIFGE